MKIELNPLVDKYLVEGCMRCKYGATPKCKVHPWREALELLRQIVMETGLKEEIKWSVPVYTHEGKNIVSVSALKDSANISFFKGVLLNDPQKVLQQQGNLQSCRIIRFTNTVDIKKLKPVLKAYIKEAVAVEESGQKVVYKKNPEPVPEELILAFKADPVFKQAFHTLTPGRQRGYIILFSQPKQVQTRIARIEKYKQQILQGKGIND
ncbi:MAG TPA: DUF1801 domain-containing protein [Sediminibacterium sp.]|nr:DUF1801 domain-containing protein [Sediminibacterium sp.]